MLFRYTGSMADHVAYQESVIYLNPDAEVELTDELTEFPYLARMIQNGILKAVSRPKPKDAEELAPEPEPEPAPAQDEAAAVAVEPVAAAPATGAGTGSKTAPAPVTLTEDLK